MQRKLTVLSALFFILFVSFSCGKVKNEVAASGVNLEMDFSLQGLNNKTFILSDYRGKKPVLLFFWTTWCPFCRNEIKALNEQHSQLKKEGWEVFAINVGEPVYKIENFIQRQGLSFEVLLDKDSRVSADYNVRGVPTYFLVNKKGEVIFEGNSFPQDEQRKPAFK
jgi:peroxiredoxin